MFPLFFIIIALLLLSRAVSVYRSFKRRQLAQADALDEEFGNEVAPWDQGSEFINEGLRRASVDVRSLDDEHEYCNDLDCLACFPAES